VRPHTSPLGIVLGIDFGGTKVALATADADGTRLATVQRRLDAAAGGEAVVRDGLATARELLAETRAAGGGDLLAVGVVSPGIVQQDRVLLAPNVPGWGNLALAAAVTHGLADEGLAAGAVLTGTDAKAAALAEARWGSLVRSRCGVFLNLGTGTSAAVVVDGVVLGGAHGAAGEIGYALLHPGQPGYGAGRSPLEEHVSGRALGERASALTGRSMTAADALHDAAPQVAQLVDEALDVLALHVVNLACAVDPDTIAIGGGLLGAADVILPRLRTALAAGAPFPPDVVAARHPHDAPLVGAIALATDHLHHTRSTL